jgi:hypothetical protein
VLLVGNDNRIATTLDAGRRLPNGLAALKALMRQVRPWLFTFFNVLACGGPSSEIVRHGSPIPPVRRFVHARSGMSRIACDPELQRISDAERNALRERFGRLPW